MNSNVKKKVILNIPYVAVGLLSTNISEAYRIASGTNLSEKVQSLVLDGCFGEAFANPLPSLHPYDLLFGICCGAALRLVCYDIKDLGKQLKKIGMLVVQDQVWGRVTCDAAIESLFVESGVDDVEKAKEVLSSLKPQEAAEIGIDIQNLQMMKEEYKLVISGIESLKPADQELMVERYQRCTTIRDISRLLCISEDGVKKKLYRCRKDLKAMLNPYMR